MICFLWDGVRSFIVWTPRALVSLAAFLSWCYSRNRWLVWGIHKCCDYSHLPLLGIVFCWEVTLNIYSVWCDTGTRRSSTSRESGYGTSTRVFSGAREDWVEPAWEGWVEPDPAGLVDSLLSSDTVSFWIITTCVSYMTKTFRFSISHAYAQIRGLYLI